MAVTPSRFRVVQDAIVANVQAAQIPDGGGDLFAAGAVKQTGDVVGRVDLPTAEILFGDQDSERGETSSKQANILPYEVRVTFDADSVGTPSKPIKDVHDQVFQGVYASVMGTNALRTLGGDAKTTDFIGGGTALVPLDIEADEPVAGTPTPRRRFQINLRFETMYRHTINDATVDT